MTAQQPQRFLEATSQSVAWFWKRANSGELELSPPFQRNPVWQESQKAYLIDTILRGYPIPEIYLQSTTKENGDEIHVVVDGQQRIRACIEYVSGKFTLGDEADDRAGLYFDKLDPIAKQQVFSYKFVVRALPLLAEGEIREIFGRLNRNNVALNRQELRQATYWGEFITCAAELSQRKFWVNSGLFTSNDIRRMLDIEYVSELIVGSLYGPQNKKASLDSYYADFEAEFPDRTKVEEIFDRVIGELAQLIQWPSKLRWSRKVDFYTLFLVLSDRYEDLPLDRSKRAEIKGNLIALSEAVKIALGPEGGGGQEEIDRVARMYARGVRNSSDLGSRRLRGRVLASYLFEGRVPEEDQEEEEPEAVDKLPTTESLFGASSEEEEEEETEEEEEEEA
jgi:hypothetical protein